MIPRRCAKCQDLVEEAEATDPSPSALWAVPWVPPNPEQRVGLASKNGAATRSRESGAGSAHQGVAPAT
jgi:hypothetical protein